MSTSSLPGLRPADGGRGRPDAAAASPTTAIQLGRTGATPVVLPIDGIVPLPGNGLIAGTATLGAKRDAIALFIAATLRAMEEISADPQKGLDAAIAVVPEIAAQKEAQLAVLQATVDMWHDSLTDAQGLGTIDTDGWAKSIAFLKTLPGGLVPNPVTVDQIVDDSLLRCASLRGRCAIPG
jgi:ABC-type nitrate/sulfonate/bicarbonate transport system substrate-binding protein